MTSVPAPVRDHGQDEGPQPEAGSRPTLSDRLPRPWLFPLLVLGAVWILVLASWHFSNGFYHEHHGWYWYFWYDDSGFYWGIAKSWYPPQPNLHGAPITAAFFPVYPALIWLCKYPALGYPHQAGLIATVISGAAALMMVWFLAARIADRWLADRVVLIFAAFPGAMTLGMMYSDPLGIALLAASLLAALSRRWVLAGLAAAVATAEHPPLIVLPAALAITAAHAIWTRRDWRSVAAPLIAPLGLLGYFTWIGLRYGDFFFWPRLERLGWGHHIDFGKHILQVLTFSDPDMGTHWHYNVGVIVLLALTLAGLVLMIAARVPLPVSAFSLLLVASLILSSNQGPSPRYVWPALGIFIGAAARLPRWAFWTLLAVFAAALFFLTGYWPDHHGGPSPIPPP